MDLTEPVLQLLTLWAIGRVSEPAAEFMFLVS